jgi:hypothetical protein
MRQHERVLNVIAWIGLILLVPVGLLVFGLPGAADFLTSHIGSYASPTALVIAFYALIILRVLFGNSEVYTPVLVGILVSFLLIAAVVPLSFMGWYRAAVSGIDYLANHRLVFLTGVGVSLLGVALGRVKGLPLLIHVIVLVAAPAALIVLDHIYGFAKLG